MKSVLAVIGVVALLYFFAGHTEVFDRFSDGGGDVPPIVEQGPIDIQPAPDAGPPVVVSPQPPSFEYDSSSARPVVQRVWVPPTYAVRYMNGRPYRVTVPGHYRAVAQRQVQSKEKHFAFDIAGLVNAFRR